MEQQQTRYFKLIDHLHYYDYKGIELGVPYLKDNSTIDPDTRYTYLFIKDDPCSHTFYTSDLEEVFDYVTNAMNVIDEGVAKYAENNDRVFESGSKRDNADNKPLPFELHPYMLLRYGYHMKTGQLNYGKGNWQLTQPDADVWESGGRHFAQALLCYQDPELAKELGLDQEDHLAALLFFINMLMQNEAKRGIKPNHYFKGKTK